MRLEIDSSCLLNALDPVYVDWQNTSGIETGSLVYPFDTVEEGVLHVLPSGTVSISSGSYTENIDLWQPMTFQTSGGSVVIGQ